MNEVFVLVVRLRDCGTALLIISSSPCQPGVIAKDRMHPSIAWYLAVYPCRVTVKKKRSLLHIQLRSIPTAMIFNANNREPRPKNAAQYAQGKAL